MRTRCPVSYAGSLFATMGLQVRSFAYRPALDGLRAVAVVAVILYHSAFPASGGYLGVDIFFVLSGYLITSLLLEELGRNDRIDYLAFLRRRVRRLLPAALLVLITLAIYTRWRGDPSSLTFRRRELLAAIGYASNWYFIQSSQGYFEHFVGVSPLRHMWSLAVEEQFYIFWPLALPFVVPRTPNGGRRASYLVFLIITSAFAMALLYRSSDPSRAYYGTDARIHEPLVGALLAVVMPHFCSTPARPTLWLSMTAGPALFAILVAALVWFSDSVSLYYRGGSLLFCILVACLIATIETAPDSALGRLLSASPLRWMGKVSYGAYLWHWPLLVIPYRHAVAIPTWLRIAGLTSLTFVVAYASFVLVERPLRDPVSRIGRRFARATFRTAFFGMLVTAGIVVTATQPTGNLAHEVLDVADDPCEGESLDRFPFCTKWHAGAGHAVVAVVGDSTAAALTPGLAQQAREHDFSLVQATRAGCSYTGLPFVDGPTQQFLIRQERCVALVPKVLPSMLAAVRPQVVLATDRVSLMPLHYEEGDIAPGTALHATRVREGVQAFADNALSLGARVVFLETVPLGPPLTCLGAARVGECAPVAADDHETAVYNEILREVAGAHADRISVLSVTDIVCPGGRCVLEDEGGVVIRFDRVHYTRRFSLKLGARIVERLTQAVTLSGG